MRRVVGLLWLLALVAVSCSIPERSVEELGLPPAEDESSGGESPEEDGSGDDAEDDTPEATPIIDFSGAIAIGGPQGLVIAEPNGEAIVEPDEPPGVATQPTWSRDGERAAAFIPTVSGGSVIIVSEDETVVAEATRPYFFFSWSGDGQYLAALGPGPQGTSLDVLDQQGQRVSTSSFDAGSLFLAWEPNGQSLVLHGDDALWLVDDPTDLAAAVSLGEPGQFFTAPAWIPATREVIIVDEADDGRLVRLDVDTQTRIDLGPVGYDAGFVVSPDGSRLFLTHAGPNLEFSDDITVSYSQPTQILGDVLSEVLFLDSGQRVIINYQPTWWAEWSPNAESVLMLQPGTERPSWRLISADGMIDLGEAELSDTFAANYVLFAWQYVESPRLWSPNSNAFVYGAQDAVGPGIVVHQLGSGPSRIADGDVAFWAPELPASAPVPT